MKKILLLQVLTALATVTSQAQAGSYDTLKTESRIAGLNISFLHRAPEKEIGDYPVLFLHGSVIPVNVSFGFRMNNYSWMDNLAANGFDVYALDFLGYGNSDRYPEMTPTAGTSKEKNAVAAGRLPGRATETYLDVAKAVDFICRRTGKDKVVLIGDSWGGQVAGLYVTKFNDKVAKLILVAALTPKQGSTRPITIQRPYTAMTPEQRVETFKNLTPAGQQCQLEKEMFTSFGRTWLLSDPLNWLFNDDSVRFPSGPAQDTDDLLHNKTYYNPGEIKVPVLIVRGDWDPNPGDNDEKILLSALKNAPYKKYVVIAKSTHILHLEKNRVQLYDEVLRFLKGS
jgi:pimeloyl-ACP methyl ester carboxylesterase